MKGNFFIFHQLLSIWCPHLWRVYVCLSASVSAYRCMSTWNTGNWFCSSLYIFSASWLFYSTLHAWKCVYCLNQKIHMPEGRSQLYCAPPAAAAAAIWWKVQFKIVIFMQIMTTSILTKSPKHKIYITYKRKNRCSIKGDSVNSYKYTYLNEAKNKECCFISYQL